MKIIIQLILLLFLFATYSCSKEKIEDEPVPCPNGEHTTVIIPELEAYLFDTGSY